jgi:hypothetical protein
MLLIPGRVTAYSEPTPKGQDSSKGRVADIHVSRLSSENDEALGACCGKRALRLIGMLLRSIDSVRKMLLDRTAHIKNQLA